VRHRTTRGRGHGRGGSSSSGSSNKPIDDESYSKSKKEQADVLQDEEDASLLFVKATLTRPRASGPTERRGGQTAQHSRASGSTKPRGSQTVGCTGASSQTTPQGGQTTPYAVAGSHTATQGDQTAWGSLAQCASTPGSMVEVMSSVVEIKLKEEKVFAHLDEEKEHDARTWVLDTGATNHMSGCWMTVTKIDMRVLGTV
jgi:hypothetical protein